MPLVIVIMFQLRFVKPIRYRIKHHTIRRPRKRPIRAGDLLSLRFWADKPYRSEQIEFKLTACLKVRKIRLSDDGIEIDGRSMSPSDQQRLAKSDGFESLEEMLNWHREVNGLPFEGEMIEWPK